VKKGAPVHCAYAATRGRRASRRWPKRACRPWCQEGDGEHGSALGAMWLGSARRTSQWCREHAELSGVRRHDGKLAAA
jgi:hypothetical protein